MTVRNDSTSSRLRTLIRSFGPAWVVMIAEVDAASILTAATDGAIYSYSFVWFLLLLVVPLFLIQEAAGRIGVATGRGLGEIVRENYSPRIGLLTSLPFLSLPVVYLVYLLIVWKRGYVTVEKFLVVFSAVLIVS